MILGFKTELNLNSQQRTGISKHAGTACHAWNSGLWLTKNILFHNQENPTRKLKFSSGIDFHKLLIAIVTIKIVGLKDVQITRIGVWKTCENSPQAKPRNRDISGQANRWFIAFKIEIKRFNTPKSKYFASLDLGVKSLAMFSNGKVFQLVDRIKLLAKKIQRMQWLQVAHKAGG
jgi:putative transposase